MTKKRPIPKRDDPPPSKEEDNFDTSSVSQDESLASDKEFDDRVHDKKRREAALSYLATLQNSTKLSGKLMTERPVDDNNQSDDEVDAAALDKDIIASRLNQDILQSKGKVFRQVADTYSNSKAETSLTFKSGNHPPTCVVFSHDDSFVFSGYKSGDIIQWDVKSGRKVYSFPRRTLKDQKTGHKGHVLCLATSFDGRYLVSGGRDNLILVWDLQNKKVATAFTAHRGPVTGLTFQMGTMTLFSTSADRTVKIWNLNDLAYVDTLFGHQDEVLAVDALNQERCITVGSRDKTVRLWKVPEETQLVFRCVEDAGGSVETITFIDSDHFATGSDNGSLSIWALHKKKPLITEYSIHGANHPITCLLSYRQTDLLCTGSDDGHLKLWKIDTNNYQNITQIASIPVEGFINGVAMSDDGKTLALALGKEQRLGRWTVHRSAKNVISIVKL